MTTDEKRLGKLGGKIALITGGNSRIGLATAKRFVNEGAYLLITGRPRQQLHHGNGTVCRRWLRARLGG